MKQPIGDHCIGQCRQGIIESALEKPWSGLPVGVQNRYGFGEALPLVRPINLRPLSFFISRNFIYV